MKTMNRRDALKMIPVAGLAFLGGRYLMRSDRTITCYAISDAPEADVTRLLRLLDFSRASDVDVTALSVAPVAQDLTLIIAGRTVDPVTDPATPRALAAFAREVRDRPRDGHRMIAIEGASPSHSGVVRFEVDGIIREEVPVGKCYARIEISGAMGNTAFRLNDGRLSVIEASCRHELCRKMRARSSGRIICAPNRLVATLPRPHGLIDAMTG